MKKENILFPEKALLVGVLLPEDNWDIEISLAELEFLSVSAGAEVIAKIYQKKIAPNPAFFIGSGKIDEIKKIIADKNINLVICDFDLSPSQQQNLENNLKVKVVDRTQLILDIFAQRARTKEGKIQVELAQLLYLLPRLTGKGIILSRLGGGIGTRGPGETKLEVDRRHIRKRISNLKKELEEIKKNRNLYRKKRQQSDLKIVSLVGYTNAGKSTLMNILTKANIYTADKLFATLDPTTRLVKLKNSFSFLLTDTVGFIHKLPPHLISAFKSTLEEIKLADLLLNVVDASSNIESEKNEVVQKILQDLEINNKPQITVYNKIDLLPEKDLNFIKSAQQKENIVFISALKKQNLDLLLKKIEEKLAENLFEVNLLLPLSEQQILAQLYNTTKVLEKKFLKDKIYLKVLLNEVWKNKLNNFITSKNIKLLK